MHHSANVLQPIHGPRLKRNIGQACPIHSGCSGDSELPDTPLIIRVVVSSLASSTIPHSIALLSGRSRRNATGNRTWVGGYIRCACLRQIQQFHCRDFLTFKLHIALQVTKLGSHVRPGPWNSFSCYSSPNNGNAHPWRPQYLIVVLAIMLWTFKMQNHHISQKRMPLLLAKFSQQWH